MLGIICAFKCSPSELSPASDKDSDLKKKVPFGIDLNKILIVVRTKAEERVKEVNESEKNNNSSADDAFSQTSN